MDEDILLPIVAGQETVPLFPFQTLDYAASCSPRIERATRFLSSETL